MGPTFGIKGGAAGGGYSQVIPMERLNLHLTGDFHAITAAHNLLAAMLDNSMFQGNPLDIDIPSIEWRRVMDVNDRALRNVIIGLGAKLDGIPRQTGFDITAASELMVLLALATDDQPTCARVWDASSSATTRTGAPSQPSSSRAPASMAVLLQDALKPNLLQTIEGQPVLVHTGPVRQHRHRELLGRGRPSRHPDGRLPDHRGRLRRRHRARRSSSTSSAGSAGCSRTPRCWSTTVRAMKAHSGNHDIRPGKPLPEALLAENPDEVVAGAANLMKHLENVASSASPPWSRSTRSRPTTPVEHDAIRKLAESPAHAWRCAPTSPTAVPVRWSWPGRSRRPRPRPTTSSYLYDLDQPLVAQDRDGSRRELYGADGVDVSPTAAAQIARYEKLGYGRCPS